MGLPIDEAIQFWRQGYGNTMTDDKFNKEYKYNIRHAYGLEGARKNYQARKCELLLTYCYSASTNVLPLNVISCHTIIKDNRPGPGDAHGCPFRDFPADKLKSTLSTFYSIPYSSLDMEDILRATDSQLYHVACTRVFELTHGGQGLVDGDSVTHPNQYAARSREIEKEKEEGAVVHDGNTEAMKVDSTTPLPSNESTLVNTGAVDVSGVTAVETTQPPEDAMVIDEA